MSTQLVAGWTLALFFQVAHVVDDAVFPVAETDGGKAKIPSGWAEMQVLNYNDWQYNIISKKLCFIGIL